LETGIGKYKNAAVSDMTKITQPPFQAPIAGGERISREWHHWMDRLFQYLQFGRYNDGNYWEFDEFGFLSAYGKARVERELIVYDASAKLPASGAPTWVSFRGSEVLSYAPNQDNTIHFAVELPHIFTPGTDISCHVHFVPTSTNTGDLRWEFTYSFANIGSVFPVETSVAAVVAVDGTQYKHQIADPLFTFANPGDWDYGGIALCSLTRTGTHADDTYPDAVYNIAVVFHITQDRIGSVLE
jgi:hypothetical protein